MDQDTLQEIERLNQSVDDFVVPVQAGSGAMKCFKRMFLSLYVR